MELKKILLSLFFTCGWSVVFSQIASTAIPDVGAGKKKATACFACHGVEGISKMPGTPHLAGQEPIYLEGALRAYRDGITRQNAAMNAIAKALSDSDIANISAYYGLQTRMNQGQMVAQTLETLQRIRPVARVNLQASEDSNNHSLASVKPSRSGEAVYQVACASCHASGVAGAPKLADKSVWTGRFSQGKAALVKHAIDGYKAMPAKGACSDCSDEEIKIAVDYMLSKVQ
jgi:cytochrome c5